MKLENEEKKNGFATLFKFYPKNSTVSNNLISSIADLLNQCIVLGMQNIKELTDHFDGLNYVDRICPPAFLERAEEFSEYGTVKNEKFSPTQRRPRSKER